MYDLHKLNIDGHKIVALEFNKDKSGIPVIFIHGIAGSVSFWKDVQTPIFNDEFHWYSLSLPGHYPAEFPEEFSRDNFTGEMIASVLTKAIRELVADQQVLLVGHSTGGFAALNIASYSPKIAAGLISISGFSHGKWIGILGIFQKLVRWGHKPGEAIFIASYNLHQRSSRLFYFFPRFYAANVHELYRNLTREMGNQIHADFTHLDLAGLVHYFSRMPDIDITDMLQQITAPTLVLAGESDPIVSPTQATVIAKNIQNSQLTYLPKTGHVPMYESPEDYHQVITNWVKNTFGV